jgi:mono/diheme cytochrome c family protein
MPNKSLALVSTLFLTACVASAQNPPKPAQGAAPAQTAAPAVSAIPPAAVNQPNPVKPTAESIASGKKMYGYDCAMCHGGTGDGKGDLAGDMKLELADFRDPKSLKGKTDGELFYVIKNGRGQMPAEGTRVKPDMIWDMVNYIRSLAKTEAAAKAK